MADLPNGAGLPVQETKLFVGNLPQNITQEELREKLEPFGLLVDVHIMNKPSVRSGAVCAFVEYSTMEACHKAIAALDKRLHFEGSPEPCVVRLKNVSYDKGAKGIPVSVPGKAKGKGKFGGTPIATHDTLVAGAVGVWAGAANPVVDHYKTDVAHGWTEHKDPDGRSYFWNSRTSASTWERPVELQPRHGIPTPPPPPLPMLPLRRLSSSSQVLVVSSVFSVL